ncbi:hypothetical protein RRSWK_00392 [Rhodopirellula sp. SWK7]|nr:hypothetical protein RRSWK_00392 [Rhodopirellula sp. SWK7]
MLCRNIASLGPAYELTANCIERLHLSCVGKNTPADDAVWAS